MSTRSRIAYCFNEKASVPSSYCHFDGYLEGVGIGLMDKYLHKDDAFYLATSGDFRSLFTPVKNADGIYETLTVDQLDHYSKFPLPTISDNLDDLLSGFRKSDCEFLYVFMEEKNDWYVWASRWSEEKGCYLDFIGSLSAWFDNYSKSLEG